MIRFERRRALETGPGGILSDEGVPEHVGQRMAAHLAASCGHGDEVVGGEVAKDQVENLSRRTEEEGGAGLEGLVERHVDAIWGALDGVEGGLAVIPIISHGIMGFDGLDV